MNFWVILSALSTAASSVVSLLTVYFLYKQNREANLPHLVIERFNIDKYQAELPIGVELPKALKQPDSKNIKNIKITNIGRGPAVNLKIRLNIAAFQVLSTMGNKEDDNPKINLRIGENFYEMYLDKIPLRACSMHQDEAISIMSGREYASGCLGHYVRDVVLIMVVNQIIEYVIPVSLSYEDIAGNKYNKLVKLKIKFATANREIRTCDLIVSQEF